MNHIIFNSLDDWETQKNTQETWNIEETTTNYNWFVLKTIDETPKSEQQLLEEKKKKEKEKQELENRKLVLILKHFSDLKDKFWKYVWKYPRKINIIKKIFISIWVIKTSTLYSKEKLENDIFNYFDTQNIHWYDNYISRLLLDAEWKKWFPKDIVNALFNIRNSFEELFPDSTDHNTNNSNDIWNTWWKIR